MRSVANLCERLAAEGHEVRVLTTNAGSCAGDSLHFEAGAGGRSPVLSQRLVSLPEGKGEEFVYISSASQFFLFPSLHENFGNVELAALACGCPVAMSNHVGLSDELAGVTGMTVPRREPMRWLDIVAAALRTTPCPVDAADVLENRYSRSAVTKALVSENEKLL